MVSNVAPRPEMFDEFEETVTRLEAAVTTALQAGVAREKQLGKRVKRATNKVRSKRWCPPVIGGDG